MSKPEEAHWSSHTPLGSWSLTETLLVALAVLLMVLGLLVAIAGFVSGPAMFLSGAGAFVAGAAFMGLFKLIQLASQVVQLLRNRS